MSSTDTLKDFKLKVQSKLGVKLEIDRIGLRFETEVNSQKTKVSLSSSDKFNSEYSRIKNLADYGIKEKTLIEIYDLGYQINFRTVYITEYTGPIIINALLFLRIGHFNNPFIITLIFLMTTFHYAKRVWESIFVHSFTRDTMTILALIPNCSYYWLLFGVLCCSSLYSSSYDADVHLIGNLRLVFVPLFFYFEYKNHQCHLVQKRLKDENKGERGIPFGHGFDLVSCANYYWEFLAWLSFAIFTGHWTSFLFCIFGLVIMAQLALVKHKYYLKSFPNYPKNRKAIIPYIL